MMQKGMSEEYADKDMVSIWKTRFNCKLFNQLNATKVALDEKKINVKRLWLPDYDPDHAAEGFVVSAWLSSYSCIILIQFIRVDDFFTTKSSKWT